MNSKIRGGVKSAVPAPRATVSAAQGAYNRAFDRAVKASGKSNQFVADHVGVAEKTLRSARAEDSGECLASYRVLMLPPSVFGPMLRELAAEHANIHGTGLEVTPERQAHALVGEALDAVRAIHDAMADGIIDDLEEPELNARLACLEGAAQKYREAVRRRSASRGAGTGGGGAG